MFHKLLIAGSLLASAAVAGASTTIDFEQYASGTQITNQYASQGITFNNAYELVAPDYNYFGYPPHSGNGVADELPNSPLSMTFSTPQTLVTGYYTSDFDATLTAYDSLGNLVETVDLSSNYGSNSLFTVSGTDITTIDLNGSPDFLTIDDVTFSQSAATPEPSSLVLLGTGIAGFAGVVRRRFQA